MSDASGTFQSFNLIRELRTLLGLAGPMMLAQVGLVTMGVVDTLCVGRVSTNDMGGVALGSAITVFFLIIGTGVAMGLEPLVAQAHGAGEERRTRAWRYQALWATSIVAIPATILSGAFAWVVPHLNWAPGFAEETQAYLWGRAPSILLMSWYTVYRGYLSATNRSRAALFAVLVANGANIVFDLFFLFQLELGALGVGIATSLASVVMLLVCRAVVREPAHPEDRRPVWADLTQVLHLGWPIAAQLAAEVGIFSGVSTLIATEGAVALAAHQIALHLSSLTFMAAVGLAVGATSRVGYYIGQQSTKYAQQIGLLAIGMGGVFTGLGGLGFVLFSDALTWSFAPHSSEVRAQAVIFLQIAAVFAVSDGVQAVGAGALRGAGHTKSTFYINLIGHGFVGVPVALSLGIFWAWGGVGYWWGLTAGLTATALLLLARFYMITSKPISRAEVVFSEALASK